MESDYEIALFPHEMLYSVTFMVYSVPSFLTVFMARYIVEFYDEKRKRFHAD